MTYVVEMRKHPLVSDGFYSDVLRKPVQYSLDILRITTVAIENFTHTQIRRFHIDIILR